MNPRILQWLKANQNIWFTSPRKQAFSRRREPDNFKITYVDETNQKVGIKFRKSKFQALPLHFWMFTRTIQYLQAEKGFIPLGAAVKPPYIKGSIEEAVWRRPFPTGNTEYKVSSHICDILSLMDYIEYGHARNPETNRRVQGARIKGVTAPPPPEPEPVDPKIAFLRKYKPSILSWIQVNETETIEARNHYNWKGMTTLECVDERNKTSRTIIKSRIKNHGAIDIQTIDEVMKWGGFGKFPVRDPKKVFKITSKSFKLIDQGNIEEATFSLMSTNGVGIARATKILGLSDQEALVIFDSRVGHALRSLTHEGERIIHIPPSRAGGRIGDLNISNRTWAKNYQKLIWILEVIREYLSQRNIHYRLADVEMALFMMGAHR